MDLLVTEEGIDPKRLYVTGMSNGAVMAYRLACESPRRLAAIGPVAGTMAVTCQDATPTSILGIHGLADRHVPFLGGLPTQGVYRSESHRAVPDVIEQWRTIGRCGPPRVTTSGAVTTNEAAGPDGIAATLITVAGAGHQWPGDAPVPAAAARWLQLEQPTPLLDATQVLWEFFAAHARP